MLHSISARGYLEKDNKVLFIEYEDYEGILYALPGGGQYTNEFLNDTLKREFKEEVGLDIEPLEIIMVREFTKQTSLYEPWRNGIHQVEVIFRCRCIYKNQVECEGSVPDPGSKGFRWINKEDFKNYRIYPSVELAELIEKEGFPYLTSRD